MLETDETKKLLKRWKIMIRDAPYNRRVKFELQSLVKSINKLEPEKKLFLARHYIRNNKPAQDKDIAKELSVSISDYKSERSSIEKELHTIIQGENFFTETINKEPFKNLIKNSKTEERLSEFNSLFSIDMENDKK